MSAPIPRMIGEADACTFWLAGQEVYRAGKDTPLSIYGMPCDARWECSLAHWERYRETAFSWVRT